MIEFQGRTLLSWQQSALEIAGISQVGIVAGFCKESFGSSAFTVFENALWGTTNMVRSLQCAHSWLSEAPCIVSYSDIFYEAEAVRILVQADSDITVLYDVNWLSQWEDRFENPLVDAETFRVSPGGAILEIGNRAVSTSEIVGQFMGLLRFTPPGWKRVSEYLNTLPGETIDKLSTTGLLNGLIASGETVCGLPYTGLWGEIDTQSDLEAHDRRVEHRLSGASKLIKGSRVDSL